MGHDREGQLILFHADGQTEQRGLTYGRWQSSCVNKMSSMPSTWMEAVLLLLCSMGPWPVTLQITARTTCGAVPAKCPLWCVCMNRAASHPTAVAMGPVWMATVNAPATSGGARPAASWTVAPPTAASMGCAQRLAATVMLGGQDPTAVKSVLWAGMGQVARGPASVSTSVPVTRRLATAASPK